MKFRRSAVNSSNHFLPIIPICIIDWKKVTKSIGKASNMPIVQLRSTIATIRIEKLC